MKFELTEKELAKFREWKSKHEEVHTTIGDRYEFRFCPTTIGLFVSVYDPLTEENYSLTDYDKI